MNKQSLVYILVLSLLMMNCSTAQQPDKHSLYITKKTATGKTKKYFDKGMEYTRAHQNTKAIKEFEKALKLSPKFIDAYIQSAALYYEMENYAAAEVTFERAIDIDENYKNKVLYVLGIAEMKQDKCEEAIEHFDRYVELEKKNKTLIAKAKKHKATCHFTLHALRDTVPFEPVNLGDKINTNHSEYLPSITADESVLVFTRRVGNQEDFYLSKKVNGEWQEGIPLDDINTQLNEGAQSISADGKLLVFTGCNRRDGYGSCDLYFSEVVNGKWTKVANMGSAINSRARETQPSLSADGKALYFSSNRAGGYGEMDIWVSKRNDKGEWTRPENLGETINTEGVDRAPFIHPDGHTLYFMSNGHAGMGGHDLFFSRLINGEWTAPVNLGYPINTEADEGTLVISLDGKTAYFATDRNKSGERGMEAEYQGKVDLDLYSFELYEAARPLRVTYVKAQVRDAATGQDIAEAKIEITDLSSGKIHAASMTDADGEFLICLPLGKNYSLSVSKELYIFHSENFALDNTNQLDKPFLLDIGLQAIPISSAAPDHENPAIESKPIILKNVFFETGSAALKDASVYELRKLKKLLVDNPQIKIRINGHTDDVGSEEDNLRLSEDRAMAVFDFLIKEGISAERLSYKGFGESLPIASNDNPKGRQLNRRTEFVVLQ